MSIFAGAGLGTSGSLGTLFIRFTAHTSELIRGMGQAEGTVERSSARMAKSVVGFSTAAITALAGLSAAALREFAMFEDSFAGVRKTVDATENVFAQLSESFRAMAREMPTNVNEINRVAEAAGSLGIQTKAIQAFTKTMIDMGNTTNLSSEEAATQMARFANIVGMSQDNFDRLGSSIVDLGNKLATTEAEILSMGLRLAGAGNQVGMAEHEILALAGALSSVGVEAEMGGTAMSQAMIKMAQAVKTGSDELVVFAHTAGMTIDEFKVAFEKDAANAVLTFLTGLKQLRDSGADVFTLLDQMGIDGVRLTDVMLRASGAQQLFNDALRIGKNAWEENTALTEEARKRYETFSSQLTISLNLIRDILITVGEGLAPAFRLLNEEFQNAVKNGGLTNETFREMGEIVGAVLYAAIHTVTAAVKGLRDAFKLVAIVVAEVVAFVLDGLQSIVNKINVVIRAINASADRLPDWIKKHGIQSRIPEIGADLGATAAMFREAANELGSELEKAHIPQAELKRTTEEVVAGMAEGYNEVVARINETSKATQQLTAETKSLSDERKAALAAEDAMIKNKNKLVKGLDDMPDARTVAGPRTFGFGFGNPALDEVTMMEHQREEAKNHLQMLAELEQFHTSLTEEQQQKRLALTEAYNDKLMKLRQAEYEIAVVSAKNMFDDLASIAEAFGGRQTGIYKAMFAASKAFAIAESIIKIQQGIAAAAAIPWPANLAAIASVVAATSNIVSTIQSVKLEFGGKRERGGPVAPGRSFLVGEKGPELFTPSARGSIVSNSDLRGEVKVIVNNHTPAQTEVTEREVNGERIVEIAVRQAKNEIASEIAEDRGPVSRAMSQAYSLRRGLNK